MIKILKTEKEYDEALERIDALMDAEPGSAQEEELELLVLLVEKYEQEHFPIAPPDPVEAILFRMDQQGLAPKDMIPYLGSQSKVSEVLNRKRPLSLTMIRNLHAGLGIPLESLVGQPVDQGQNSTAYFDLNPEIFSFNCKYLADESNQDKLQEWCLKITQKASTQKIPPFDRGNLHKSLFVDLIRLSSYPAGPKMAFELINKKGIHVIVQKIESDIKFDGACLFSPEKHPVIGLTLQNDRLDDFWFTLLHLLAHLYMHQSEKSIAFFHANDCVFDETAPEEESQENQLLKDAWISYFNSDNKIGDEYTYGNLVRIFEISPEMLSCWLRIVWDDNESSFDYELKKISEDLEVYG